MSNEKNQIGHSSFAEPEFRRKGIAVIALGVFVLGVIGYVYFSSKKPENTEAAPEEVYSLSNEPSVDKGKAAVKQKEEARPVVQQNPIVMQEAKKLLQQRLSAPLMLVSEEVRQDAKVESKPKEMPSSDPNKRFMEQLTKREDKPAVASEIGRLGAVVAQGRFIQAILESATDSDLPGNLRAVVTQPTYSEDGSRILIPRGSRLVGEYKSGMMQGQSRIFVVWTRLLTPEGISVQLSSAGIDTLGVAGLAADTINRHFWQRFGMASLLSIIGTGASSLDVNGTNKESASSLYRAAIANSFSQSASESLQQDGTIAPTLKTYQGKPVMVFVAKDLQFADVLEKTNLSINVF